jgi:hypothetical protein
MSDASETTMPCDDAEVMRLWREVGLPEYFLGNGGTNHKLVAFAEAAVLAERERIAHALEAEADMGDCSEDNMVMRDAAWLVRADFSYDEVERLQAKSEAEALEARRHG